MNYKKGIFQSNCRQIYKNACLTLKLPVFACYISTSAFIKPLLIKSLRANQAERHPNIRLSTTSNTLTLKRKKYDNR